MRILLFSIIFLTAFSLLAQESSNSYDWTDFLESITTDEENADSEEWIQYVGELQQLHEHPVNINTATREELRRLPMLDDRQIEQIHAYIYLHGQMQTLGELRLLPLIDEDTRRALALFLFARQEEQPSSLRLLSNLHGTFSSRLDVPFYRRQGYLDGTYVGNSLYHRVRYQMGNSQHFQAGLRVEKDPGERFYDYYGGYAQLHDVGILANAVVGDYRAGFGEGLVMGAGSTFSKSNLLGNNGRGIRPMTSMSETDYLRGGALTLRLSKELQLTTLLSYRQLDATLNDEGEVQTFLRTGYHRTLRERATRHDVSNTLMGAHLEWKTAFRPSRGEEATPFPALGSRAEGKVGATFLYFRFSRPLNPGEMLYRRYFPRGNQFAVFGVNYGYQLYRWTFAGETAYSCEQGGIATLNRIRWMASRRWTMSLLQRYYGKKYYSFGASALAESTGGFNTGGAGGNALAGRVQNETGILMSVQGQLAEGWNLTSYLDLFHHPWPRYGMTHSSTGQEGMCQVGYQVNRQHTLVARYQVKRKEAGDIMQPHHRLKLQWIFTSDQTQARQREVRQGEAARHSSVSWVCKTVGTIHQVQGSTGIALGESVQSVVSLSGSGHPSSSLRLTAFAGWFHTESYASRICFYTPSLYNCSYLSPAFSGHGCHHIVGVRWKEGGGRKHKGNRNEGSTMEWWMEARCATTCFFDRDQQNSGAQTIHSRWKTDAQLQLVMKF